uniref:Uncharacterized protein n=1 Tax=Anguilla anguilla TaxID=7936 RepID=A0A0E9X2J5_ANGAN
MAFIYTFSIIDYLVSVHSFCFTCIQRHIFMGCHNHILRLAASSPFPF